jgi:benzoyl-CoA reductase/2-hydroxyglutaryl-CoA dehydratase subunit BcrC/BadD/HgdB
LSYAEILRESEERLRRLSKSGATLLGYVYPHAPLELLLAHGTIPSLVRTNPSVQGGFEASLQTFSCSLSRNLFSQRSSGWLSYFDGFLFPCNTCDSLHNVEDVWRRRFAEDNIFRLTYPAARYDENSVRFFAEELRLLSGSLKKIYGRPLSNDALSAAVSLVNDFRDAAQTLYSCRIVDPSVASYSEGARMVREFLTIPSRDAVDRIRKAAEVVSQELERRGQLTVAKSLQKDLLSRELSNVRIAAESDIPRILVLGGMMEPLVVASLFNDAVNPRPDVVVLDMLSFGFKTVFAPPVIMEGDPFIAISKSILSAPSEPTQEGLSERLDFLKLLLPRLSIDGVVVCEQSFCDPDQFEAPSLVRVASEMNVPSVRLPVDPELSDRIRLEGRIESFLETLDGGPR